MLSGKVAIVTGSSRGIGAATARLFAEQGAAVIVNYHQSKEKGKQVLEEIQAKGGRGILVKADVTNQDQVNAMVKRALKEFGQIDILVNNASIGFLIVGAGVPARPWADTEVGPYNCCQAVLPCMMERRSGKIINVSSGLSRTSGQGFIAHAAAKLAMDGFSKVLALELGPYGISVNVVAPGLTLTDATAWLSEEARAGIAERIPLRRNALPEDVAKAILFFAADLSVFITGQYLPVNGGTFMI